MRVGMRTSGRSLPGSATKLTAALTLASTASGLGTVTATVSVQNTGSASATGVEARVRVDPGLAVASASGTGWTVVATGQEVYATRSSALAASATAPDLTITCTARNSQSETSEVRALARASNAPAAQATARCAVSGVLEADLVVPATVNGGSNLVLSCSALNQAAASATALSVAVTLPSGATYVSGSGTGWSFAAIGQVVTATLTAGGGSLARGARTGSFTITASTTDPASDQAKTVSAVASSSNPYTSPTASASVTVKHV